MVCIEIFRQHSKPFLVCSWYRPPNANINLFDNFERFIQKFDIENKELIALGDFNCDVSKSSCDNLTQILLNICTLYQPKQWIEEPTRVTKTTATLIVWF